MLITRYSLPPMPIRPGQYKRVASLKTIEDFKAYLGELEVSLPLDDEILKADASPLAESINVGAFTIGNRFCIHPMEGWDGTEDGRPTEYVTRRWRNFGTSGAKLIWGGEAVAVTLDGRANPNQLCLYEENKGDFASLRKELVNAHHERFGKTDDLLVGLQLTHSGRFCKPNNKFSFEHKLAYRHPVLDRKFHIDEDLPILTDDQIKELIERFITAATLAVEAGFQFVDIKHCHGYLLHEFLSARSREGEFGGSLENRSRFLRQVVQGIRANHPDLLIGIRLSAFDFVAYKPDPELTTDRKLGPGIPENLDFALPYNFGFGADAEDPTRYDLTEPFQLMEILRELGIKFVNLSAGSPYYNPHIQRPALFPPSDGYLPPEDPLVGVARQIHAHAEFKKQFSDFVFVGTGYTYLQDYLPHVAQATVREGLIDIVGLGRMVLSYHDLPHDVLTRGELSHKRICRTFSDCTTAPRNGLISGCYPLDDYYKNLPVAIDLKQAKARKK